MSTYSINQIPTLAPHVGRILMRSATLRDISTEVLGLVPRELTFSLLLATVLPVFADSHSHPYIRIAALYVLAGSHESGPETDPFRTAHLDVLRVGIPRYGDFNDDGVPVEVERTSLEWAVWYILAGLRDRLGVYRPYELPSATFPLPTGDAFGLSAASQTARASSSRSRETSPTRDSLAQLVRLTYIARTRALSSREERMVPPLVASHTDLLPFLFPSKVLPRVAHHNPDLVKVFLSSLLTDPSSSVLIEPYLNELASLPPTLPSLELLSKLLRESGAVGDTIKAEALGRFIAGAVAELDGLELRGRAGEAQVNEEIARGVNILSRFLLSLLQSNTLHPTDALLVEATSFTLRYSRFSQAQILYRTIVGTEGGENGGSS